LDNASASNTETAQDEIPNAATPSRREKMKMKTFILEDLPENGNHLPFFRLETSFRPNLQHIYHLRKDDWKKKVSCISSLATNSSLFSNFHDEAGRAIIDIVLNSQ
jgi:hypothetical protein